jgi:hypothetical protein
VPGKPIVEQGQVFEFIHNFSGKVSLKKLSRVPPVNNFYRLWVVVLGNKKE